MQATDKEVPVAPENAVNPLNNAPSTEKEQVKINESKADNPKKSGRETDSKVTKRPKKEARKSDAIKRPTNKFAIKDLSKASKDIVVAEFVDILSASDLLETNKTIAAKSLYQSLFLLINNTWNSPEKMGSHVTEIFNEAYYQINTNFTEMTIGDKLVASQEITSLTLNLFSPVASNKSLAMYGEHYAVKNLGHEDIQKLTGFQGNVDELMSNVKAELGIVKENVLFANGEFDEKVSAKSEKIDEHKPPVHGKSIE